MHTYKSITRRSFLRTVGAGAVAVSAPSLPAAAALPSRNTIAVLECNDHHPCCMEMLDDAASVVHTHTGRQNYWELRRINIDPLQDWKKTPACKDAMGVVLPFPGKQAAGIAHAALAQGKNIFWDISSERDLCGPMAWADKISNTSSQVYLFTPGAALAKTLAGLLTGDGIGTLRFAMSTAGEIPADDVMQHHLQQALVLLEALQPTPVSENHTINSKDTASGPRTFCTIMTTLKLESGTRLEITTSSNPLQGNGTVLQGEQGTIALQDGVLTHTNCFGAIKHRIVVNRPDMRREALTQWLESLCACGEKQSITEGSTRSLAALKSVRNCFFDLIPNAGNTHNPILNSGGYA